MVIATEPFYLVENKDEIPKLLFGLTGSEYMLRVKQMQCVVCGFIGCDAHHCFHDRWGQTKATDFDTIPLCKLCHQTGKDSIHNAKRSWRSAYGPDYDFISQTRRAIFKDVMNGE